MRVHKEGIYPLSMLTLSLLNIRYMKRETRRKLRNVELARHRENLRVKLNRVMGKLENLDVGEEKEVEHPRKDLNHRVVLLQDKRQSKRHK